MVLDFRLPQKALFLLFFSVYAKQLVRIGIDANRPETLNPGSLGLF